MKEKNIVVLGKFDGVHTGHAQLLKKATEISCKNAMPIVVYVISVKKNEAITDDMEKENILKILGADKVIFRTLDTKLKNMLPEDFVQEILCNELNASCVVVGENFRFGKDRCGSSEVLSGLCADIGADCYVVDTLRMISADGNEETVSSTAIREYLKSGQVDFAYKYLGRPYSIKGVVTHGKHLGTDMGIPTANIVPPENSPELKKGVYASRIVIDGITYNSITNVGCNPTVEQDRALITETHILDEDIDCYGKMAEVRFIKFLRPETTFKNTEELFGQIESDIFSAKKFWDENSDLEISVP